MSESLLVTRIKEISKDLNYGQMDFLSQRQRLEMSWPQPEADRNTQKKNTVDPISNSLIFNLFN